MKFRASLEIGRLRFDMRGPWRFKAQREVTSWWGKAGPFSATWGGMTFSEKAARRVFGELDAGTVGRLARLYKPF